MIKSHIDELKPFFFEFKIFDASFKRMSRLHTFEKSREKCLTRLYNRFELFHKTLKESKAYGKVIEFEFEQKLCHKLDHDNSKSTCSSLEKDNHNSGENSASPIIHNIFTPLKKNKNELHLNRNIDNENSDWCSQERAKANEYIEIKSVKKRFSKNDVNVMLTPLKSKNNLNFKIKNLSNFNENRKLRNNKIRKIILTRNEIDK